MEEMYEDWRQIALSELREEEDNDELNFSQYGQNSDDSFVAEDENANEYIVFKNEDVAEQYAIEKVKEDLEYNPEYFNQDFLMEHVDGERFFGEIFDEFNRGYAEDIQNERGDRYENRLIDEMVEWDIMDIEEAESDEAEEIAEDRIERFVDALTIDQLRQGGTGYEYYAINFGKEEAMRLVMENGLIDIDGASEEAVRIDGIAHFISSYDGNTIYLGDNVVAYRLN